MSDKSSGPAALAVAAATPVVVGIGCSRRDGPKMSYEFDHFDHVHLFDSKRVWKLRTLPPPL